MKKNQKGFSLIELMIVVAIIGILASIAIPNYQRFQRKARQSEAKANLGALYTAMKTYFAEYGGYTNIVTHAGFASSGFAGYDVGFGDAAAEVCPAADSSGCGALAYYTTTDFCGQTGFLDCTLSAVGAAGTTGLGDSANVGAADAAAATFTAGAAGWIGGELEDWWTMNENKVLANVQSGVN